MNAGCAKRIAALLDPPSGGSEPAEPAEPAEPIHHSTKYLRFLEQQTRAKME